MGDLGNSLDLPYEDNPGPVPMPDQHVHFSGGVVVMPSTVDVPEVGKKPALVFRFAMPEGGFYTAICLVADDEQMAKLRPLIAQSIHAAREAAKRGG